MAADPLNEQLVLSEEPPAESSPAAAPSRVHRRHLQVQQQEQYDQQPPPPPPLPAVPPAGRPGAQVSRGRDGDGSHHCPKMSLAAQITVNPATAAATTAPVATHWQGHRVRTSYHPAPSAAPQPPPATSGLRFNVVQQHHGKHNTSELVPVTEDERAPPPTDRNNGVGVNNNNGRQAGYAGGGSHRGGMGLPHSEGRKQDVAGSMGAIKSVDIGECGKKWVPPSPLFIIMYANENLEMILASRNAL